MNAKKINVNDVLALHFSWLLHDGVGVPDPIDVMIRAGFTPKEKADALSKMDKLTVIFGSTADLRAREDAKRRLTEALDDRGQATMQWG